MRRRDDDDDDDLRGVREVCEQWLKDLRDEPPDECWAERYARQGVRCRVCGVPVDGRYGPLCLDHAELLIYRGLAHVDVLTDWDARLVERGPYNHVRKMTTDAGTWPDVPWQRALAVLLEMRGVGFSGADFDFATAESPGDALALTLGDRLFPGDGDGCPA